MIDEREWRETFAGSFRGDVKFGVSLKERTSLAIGGPCDVLAEPGEPVSLRNMLVVLEPMGIPFFTIGGGTNILVRDGGIDGVVISLRNLSRIEVIREGNADAELFVEAGVGLQRLVNFCKEKGYAGIEGLAGIPGTVGGAISGNAGSYGCEMKDVVVSVAVMDSAARLDRQAASAMGFGYRRSGVRPGELVLSANIRLARDEPQAVSSRTEGFFNEKKKTQPLAERSAGCVFRNPANGPAGRLIDEAGCKGMRMGGVEVSGVHANFFINRGSGTAADYQHLMDEVVSVVHRRFGVVLEPEIRVVGKT
ncbi:MAG: UDP-N-acetylmuramate dehydrogenase [Nitrospiraceae bacterium]|nr:UDP-N-acetylmuramate dehydrogenase [Nitrospiraceae bacterium]